MIQMLSFHLTWFLLFETSTAAEIWPAPRQREREEKAAYISLLRLFRLAAGRISDAEGDI